VASIPAPDGEGGIARALGRLQMLGLAEVQDGRYHATAGAAEVSG
jgi:hypothetical protein